MANGDRKTARPPPGVSHVSSPNMDIELTFNVQLYYPNHIAIAQAVAKHIHKRAEDTVRMADRFRKNKAYGGLKPDTAEYEKLPESIRGVIVHAVIVGIDEFCDLDKLFEEIHRYYADGTPVIVHHTSPVQLDETIYMEYGAIGAFAGYNFSEIDPLLDATARNRVKPSEDVTLESD
jgi:hypothetical protein